MPTAPEPMTAHTHGNTDPRRIALQVLTAVDRHAQPLDQVLSKASADLGGLTARDRALFNAIVYGVLRWRGRLDWIIRQLSTTPFRKISPPVRNILRMGVFQMTDLDRIPASAAIHTAVELSKSEAGPWVGRFVNAVLRSFQRRSAELAWPDPMRDPLQTLSVEKSHPEWIIRRWVDRLGAEETAALCDANNRVPAITLRTNTLRTDRDNLAAALTPHVDKMDTDTAVPEALRIENPRIPIGQMEAFRAGGFQVQDEAAQLVSHLLSPQPGERVIDACAGRGVKTGHMAQLMGNLGEILALDRDGRKLDVLQEEMDRLGIGIVRTAVCDLPDPQTRSVVDTADRVLVDAPCSGLGVIRRHPEARWAEEKRDLKRFQERQVQLLESCAPWVRPGGVLVYAVCSLEPEEGPDVIQRFLARHPEFAIDLLEGKLPPFVRPFLAEPGTLVTLPHRHDTDGFFGVRMKNNR